MKWVEEFGRLAIEDDKLSLLLADTETEGGREFWDAADKSGK
jgi:hypothetical protein